MSQPLSPCSTLEQLISTTDEDLEAGAWNLPPRTVLDYVMFLRQELTMAKTEIARLNGVVAVQQQNISGLMNALGASHEPLPAEAPPRYAYASMLETTPSCAPPEYTTLSETPGSDSANLEGSQEQEIESGNVPTCVPSAPSEAEALYASCVPSASSEAASLSAGSPPINSVLRLGDYTFLRPGSNIQATFYFKKGTKIFSLGLLKEPGFYIFHMDFRPSPHGNMIVMDSNSGSNWEEDVRTKLPQLSDGSLVSVHIECRHTMFKVKVNGEELKRVFNYRYPIEDVREFGVTHGTNGNKWIALNYL